MALSAGTRLGPYEILAALGSGGMGEVYRARDTKLGRDVAIKVLPEVFALDADRLARFGREAQVLASLNHPNIAHLYGLEDAQGVRALIMELVDGPTLADRIAQGPIPLDEARLVARQIAEALDAAHEQGIIHRDLKPANIKVRSDGTVKVLDFGLAKAIDPLSSSPAGAALANSPTLTSPAAMTAVGVILGTAAYMAPEQARGKAMDKRSDIWAYGCVLYEMLTGKRAFPGDEVTDTIAFVITREPDWFALPPTTPASIRRVLHRCLEKDRKRRLADIADARLELEENPADLESLTTLENPANRGAGASWRRALPWAATSALAVAMAMVLVLWAPWRTVSAPAPLRLSAELGADVTLANTNFGAAAILSPDGRTLAFIAQKSGGASRIYVRRLDQLHAVALSATDGAASPFFSLDGQWIGFFADGKLKKISVTGGAAVVLCDAPNGRGGAWSDDGTIILTPDSGAVTLSRVSSAGGTPTQLTQLDPGEFQHKWPQVLPGGKAVLFTSHNSPNGFDDAQIVVQPLPGGARKVVQRGGYYGRYLPSGHLVYVAHGTLFAAPFDLNRLEPTGPSVPVLEGVMANPAITGGAQFAVADNGTLVYLPGPSLNTEVPIQWMDRDGKTAALRTTAANWASPRFSPDGRHLAIDVFDGQNIYVWVYDWTRDSLSRLTFDPAGDWKPVWTPDGRRIVFASDRADKSTDNLFWQRADGTGEIQRLTDSAHAQMPESWHPSGKFLGFTESNPKTGLDVMILPMDGNEAAGWKPGTPTVFLNSPFMEQEPMFSPDGRWLAYVSDESGRKEVYVRPFPGPGSKSLVSTGGGDHPRWSRPRHDFFYSTPDGHIMVASYTAEGDSFRAEKPQLWSDDRFLQRRTGWSFAGGASIDLHPDGDRFAVALADPQAAGKLDKIVFIFNFFDELRRIASATKR